MEIKKGTNTFSHHWNCPDTEISCLITGMPLFLNFFFFLWELAHCKALVCRDSFNIFCIHHSSRNIFFNCIVYIFISLSAFSRHQACTVSSVWFDLECESCRPVFQAADSVIFSQNNQYNKLYRLSLRGKNVERGCCRGSRFNIEFAKSSSAAHFLVTGIIVFSLGFVSVE